MTRRRLLGAVLALLATPLLSRLGLPVVQRSGLPLTDSMGLDSFFAHRESAEIVGQASLLNSGLPAPLQVALQRLASRAGGLDSLVVARAEQQRNLVCALHAEDFATGRLVSVEGWMLSETEALLCAMAARTRLGEGAES